MFGRLLAVMMVAVLASFVLALLTGMIGLSVLSDAATIACQGLLLGFLATFFAFLIYELLSESIGRMRGRKLVAAWARNRPRR